MAMLGPRIAPMLRTMPPLQRLATPRTFVGPTMFSPALCQRARLAPLSLRCYSTPTPTPSPETPPSEKPKSKLTADDVRRAMEEMQRQRASKRNTSMFLYASATFILAFGLAYAAVPFYRAFCSATGYGGAPIAGDEEGRFAPSRLVPAKYDPDGEMPSVPGSGVTRRRMKVRFSSDTSDDLPWTFTPSTRELYVLPGETALAFFRAKNHSKKDIVGIATYNVAPAQIAPFFAKVECFCFEQQRLLAGEEVDLPVFFFIDRDVLDDPACRDLDDVILSYTFFAARRNTITGDLEPDTDLKAYTVGIDLDEIQQPTRI